MTEKVEDSLLTELKNITLATFIKEKILIIILMTFSIN